ncbi:MAG TPA: metallophosphoesterase family protein, partial [Lacipirellulaceae bacterium]|nr:metallophosphoesterase family protein [Lacipirellulaceae bacterium]
PFTAREQHRPTPLPDRVVLTFSGDPATSIDVCWRTDVTTGEPVAQIARADAILGNLKDGKVPGARNVDGSRQAFESDLGECHMHSVRFDGLEPGVLYAYRVGDGQHWSEWFQFRTAANHPEPFTFVYFGDAQNQLRSLWSRVIREANQYAPRAAFMLHAGDLINSDDSDAEWGEWFGAGGWLNGTIPVVATPGNHEYDKERGLSAHWRPQFAFPLNGPSGLEETTYWFDYQGARFISLNSNERIAEQRAWLRGVLSDAERPAWTIVTFHHPIYSAAKDRDNPELRAAWRNVLEEHGVDLVLQGHDHAYARSGLGGPSNVPEGVRVASGHTVYVVSVSGPKQYALQETWDVPRVGSGVQLFQVITISPQEARYEARLATGELYDAFTLRKGADGKNALVEHEVGQPEIRARAAD